MVTAAANLKGFSGPIMTDGHLIVEALLSVFTTGQERQRNEAVAIFKFEILLH